MVTRPDVERALILWVHHMEEKGETFSGPMLLEKHKTFEEMLQVPEDERLHGGGWLGLFCQSRNIIDMEKQVQLTAMLWRLKGSTFKNYQKNMHRKIDSMQTRQVYFLSY